MIAALLQRFRTQDTTRRRRSSGTDCEFYLVGEGTLDDDELREREELKVDEQR
jgi:hypothetical protein